MATSDLQASLAAAPRSPLLPDDNDSPTGAGAVCAAVLARLADPSSDVSALAVKWCVFRFFSYLSLLPQLLASLSLHTHI